VIALHELLPGAWVRDVRKPKLGSANIAACARDARVALPLRLRERQQIGEAQRHLLLVQSDTLDRDERRACLQGDAVVSAEDDERIPDSRIPWRRLP
jgi:hypothetical protein